MNNQTLTKLGLAALVLLGIGLFLRDSQGPKRIADATGEKLLPALADSLNEVSSFTVEHSDGVYTIAQRDGIWGLDGRGGYPVRVEDVRKTLIALSDADKLEAKTRVAANYHRLGVEGPNSPDSESRLVTLRDSAEDVITRVIIGNRREGAGKPSYFARVAAEETSWLVSGDLTLSDEADSWLDKKILEIPRERVRAVQTLHPDMEEVFVARPSEEIDQFEVHNIPEGFKLKYDAVAAGMGSALQYLSFVDVQPKEGFEFPDNRTPTSTQFWTFDGLLINVVIYSVAEAPESETFYAVFNVSDGSDGPERLKTTGPEPAPAEEGEETPARSSEEIAAEVEELNAKVSGWVYEIASYGKTNLSKRQADLLDPIVAEEEGTGLSDAGGLQLPEGFALPVTEESAEAPVTETPTEDGR